MIKILIRDCVFTLRTSKIAFDNLIDVARIATDRRQNCGHTGVCKTL
jgi:hypothetical protein